MEETHLNLVPPGTCKVTAQCPLVDIPVFSLYLVTCLSLSSFLCKMGIRENRPHVSIQLLTKHIPRGPCLTFPPVRTVAIVAKREEGRLKDSESHKGLSRGEILNETPTQLTDTDNAPVSQVLSPILYHLVRDMGAQARLPGL